MRYQKLGGYAVFDVLVIRSVISSSPFEAVQVGASTKVSQIAGERPSDSGTRVGGLRRKIRFSGTVPAPTQLNMAPDPTCMQFVNTSESEFEGPGE